MALHGPDTMIVSDAGLIAIHVSFSHLNFAVPERKAPEGFWATDPNLPESVFRKV